MSNKWYYLVKGKIQGPITEEQIRSLLRTHELTLNDIIFREGDSKWRRINEFTEVDFASEANTETNLHHFVKLPKKITEFGTWVVLLSVQTEEETKFLQKGPLSEDEVKAGIAKGEISYSDHIWRSGFDKWQRIGDLEEFAFKGETQILSLSSLKNATVEKPEPAPVLRLTEVIDTKDDVTTFDDFKTAIIPNLKKEIQKEILSEPEKGKITAFSLKLDQSRIKELIQKPDPKPIPSLVEREKSQEVKAVTGKIPSLIPSATTSVVVNKTQTRSAIKFDEVEENRNETKLGLARTSVKHKPKKKVWNTVFKFTQITLLAVVLGLGYAIYQNIEKRNHRIREKVQSSSAVHIIKPAPKVTVEHKAVPVPVPAVSPLPPPPSSTAVKKLETAEPPKTVESAVEEEAPEPAEERGLASKPPEDSTPIAPRKGSANVQIKVLSSKILFPSNANQGEKISVVIKAATGEVVGDPSVLIEAQVKRKGKKSAEINLENYRIRPGYYSISATLADAKIHKERVFIGSKKVYEKEMAKYRKIVSYRQQWEKKSLLKIASDTTDLAKDLFAKYASLGSAEEWRVFYQKWRQSFKDSSAPELRTITSRNQNEFAYPEIWYDVRGIREKLNGEAESLNSAFLASRKSASVPNNKLLVEIGSLVSRVGELSGWRQKLSR